MKKCSAPDPDGKMFESGSGIKHTGSADLGFSRGWIRNTIQFFQESGFVRIQPKWTGFAKNAIP
jgi:hypothetical protein